MQHAGEYLIHKHKLYPLTVSFATRLFFAFAGRGLVVKQCAIPFFFLIIVRISLIIPGIEWYVPYYRSHEYCVNLYSR